MTMLYLNRTTLVAIVAMPGAWLYDYLALEAIPITQAYILLKVSQAISLYCIFIEMNFQRQNQAYDSKCEFYTKVAVTVGQFSVCFAKGIGKSIFLIIDQRCFTHKKVGHNQPYQKAQHYSNPLPVLPLFFRIYVLCFVATWLFQTDQPQQFLMPFLFCQANCSLIVFIFDIPAGSCQKQNLSDFVMLIYNGDVQRSSSLFVLKIQLSLVLTDQVFSYFFVSFIYSPVEGSASVVVACTQVQFPSKMNKRIEFSFLGCQMENIKSVICDFIDPGSGIFQGIGNFGVSFQTGIMHSGEAFIVFCIKPNFSFISDYLISDFLIQFVNPQLFVFQQLNILIYGVEVVKRCCIVQRSIVLLIHKIYEVYIFCASQLFQYFALASSQERILFHLLVLCHLLLFHDIIPFWQIKIQTYNIQWLTVVERRQSKTLINIDYFQNKSISQQFKSIVKILLIQHLNLIVNSDLNFKI